MILSENNERSPYFPTDAGALRKTCLGYLDYLGYRRGDVTFSGCTCHVNQTSEWRRWNPISKPLVVACWRCWRVLETHPQLDTPAAWVSLWQSNSSTRNPRWLDNMRQAHRVLTKSFCPSFDLKKMNFYQFLSMINDQFPWRRSISINSSKEIFPVIYFRIYGSLWHPRSRHQFGDLQAQTLKGEGSWQQNACQLVSCHLADVALLL